MPYNLSRGTVYAKGSPVPRELRDRFSDVVNVRDFGAKGDGVVDDTAAIQAAIATLGGNGGEVIIPRGTYLVEAPAFNNVKSGTTIRGVGQWATVLKSKTGGHVVEITGSYVTRITIRDLRVQGAGASSGTGNGIYFHDNGIYGGPSHIFIADVYVDSCGGRGIYMVEEWHTLLQGVSVDDCGDHAFDLQGGNTTQLVRCYAQKVAAGKAGFRIHGGSVLLDTANGINGKVVGAYWGIFGDSVADGDPVNRYFRGTLRGCNVEDFAPVGIVLKTGSWANIQETTFLAQANQVNTVAIDAYYTAGYGIIGAGTLFTLNAGATWEHGTPLRSFGSVPPFLFVGGNTDGSKVLPHYSTSFSATYPGVGMYPVSGDAGYHNASLKVPRLAANAYSTTRTAPVWVAGVNTVDPNTASLVEFVPTSGAAWSIADPPTDPGPAPGQRLTIRIKNTTGAVLGDVTWGTTYKLAAWTQPASGFGRTVEFLYDGTNWVEAGRTADVPN